MTHEHSTRRRLLRSLRQRSVGLARVFALLGFLSAMTLVPWVHQARATLGERFVGLGAAMMRYADAIGHDTPRLLQLNGQRLFMTVATTDDSVAEVLDAYEARCKDRDGRMAERLVRESSADPSNFDLALFDATIREGNDRKGVVACLDVGDEEMGPREWLARVHRFLETGNLAEVGQLRLVFAEKGYERTRVVAFFTEGDFHALELFPESGDAPGADPEGLPRPRGARRILSAWEEGEPYGLVVYADVEGEVDVAKRRYAAELRDAGFRVQDDLDPETRSPALLAFHGPREVVVVFCREDSKRSMATVLLRR